MYSHMNIPMNEIFPYEHPHGGCSVYTSTLTLNQNQLMIRSQDNPELAFQLLQEIDYSNASQLGGQYLDFPTREEGSNKSTYAGTSNTFSSYVDMSLLNVSKSQEPSRLKVKQDTSKPLIVNGVQIDPGEMYFRDAYDGKQFDQVLRITNLRKNGVNIRIGSPSSKAFIMKPIPIGKTLSAGLSITRRIKLVYSSPTSVPQASMDIYVDHEYIRYKLMVVPCFAHISVSPKILDYGDIDVGMVSEQKKLMITNSGTKQAQFSIDLGTNPLKLVVEPPKGTLLPGETKNILVEIFGTCEGPFNQEFWIKTDPLQKANVQGRFIEPKLDIEYPLSNKNMLILNFPNTFVGVKLQRNVIIQNHSSFSAAYCVNGRIMQDKFPYKQAAELDYNFKQFEINPLEGRLVRDFKFILNIKFCPQKPKNKSNYYFCDAIVDVKKFQTTEVSLSSEKTTNGFQSQALESISVATIEPDSKEEPINLDLFNDNLTLVLYGEVELPEVTIVPPKIDLLNLVMHKSTEEMVQFVNNSKSLPLVLQYIKAANVDFSPKIILLPPNEIVQATIKVKPTSIGDARARVAFNVLFQQKQVMIKLKTVYLPVAYTAECSSETKAIRQRKPEFLPGIVPKNHNEVGYLVDHVRFNTDIKIPKTAIVDEKCLVFNKDNDALVAFPNDRPNALKPWRNPVPCKTIFTQLPRLITPIDIDYDLTPEQQRLKDTNDSYYLNYIRSFTKKELQHQQEGLDDYVTTNRKRLLMEYKYKKKDCPLRMQIIDEPNLFSPLTPYGLQKVIVSAPFIQLGRLAAETDCSDHFTIKNNNDMAIHILIKPRYDSIRLIKHEFVLEAHTLETVEFIYHADPGGTHHIPLFIHINFVHVLVVTVLATIVANTVQCVTRNITIIPTEKTAIMELRNPINSDVGFSVDTAFFHLEAFPAKGVIPAKKNMAITITFHPTIAYSPVKEISIISESGYKDLVEVRFSHKKANVQVSKETLVFKDIPLNTAITQELIVFNKSDQLVPLTVEFEEEFAVPELTINPTKAFILQKGEVTLSFTVLFKEVVSFNIPVKLILQCEFQREIVIMGNVVSSLVTFKPELLKIPKIPCGASLNIPFKMLNNGTIESSITFLLQDYPEFNIKTKAGEYVTEKSVIFGSKERRDFFLEFHPKEPVVYCIYLPYMINKFFGPVELNVKESILCDTYINREDKPYKSNASTSTEKLKTMKILCTAGFRWLKFSDLQLNFEIPDRVMQELVIENVSGICQEIWLKNEDLESFTISQNSEVAIVQYDLIKRLMEPNETWILNIEFSPEIYGTFSEKIPIFVKDYSDLKPFNHLHLTGTNLEPRIISDVNSIYFVPSNIGVRQVKMITLDILTHKCDKKINFKYLCSEIHVVLKDWEDLEHKSVYRYMVTFAPTKDCCIETSVTFSCACLVNTKVNIYATADRAVVINFMSDPLIIKHSTYPYFPTEGDKSPYAELLGNLISIMERWLYSQGFFCTNYYTLPDTIARYPAEAAEQKAGRPQNKKQYPNLPLVQLLINLINKYIMKYIDNDLTPCPQDPQKQALFCYVTYRNAISFMKGQGIHVAGLKPHHLLTFADYTQYKNCFKCEEDKDDFGQEEFYLFSKQRWMDLCFTIYKVLVQARVVMPKSNVEALRSDDGNSFFKKDYDEFNQYYNDQIHRFPKLHECDAKLLLWLEHHYNRQRSSLWPNEKFQDPICFKGFLNLGEPSICFSVALSTLTLAYCPYLLDSLKDAYAFPKSVEQNMHNACRVAQSWKNLKLSFEVHPQSLVTPKVIKVIFMVTYLYEVLPHFYPTNEVMVEAPLSESTNYCLAIQNFGEVPVYYNAFFYGENKKLFEMESQFLTVPPKRTKSLKLTFFARRVLNASIILVLSGETSGHRYAQSQVVSITGVPQTSSSDEVKINVETYKWVRQKIPVKTPYGKKPYKAKIYICYEEPKSYADMHSFASLTENFIPREIDVLNSECEFADKGQANIILRTCFLSHGTTTFYLYFCNETIGDFCVFVTLVALTSKAKAQVIPISIKNRDFDDPCTCKRGFTYNCPKVLLGYVPSRNVPFWTCTKTMVKKFFSPGAVKICERFFDTPVIFRLLKFYLERFPQGFMLPSVLFEDKAEFSINISENYSSPSPTLLINDVFSEQWVPLVLHWNESGKPRNALLELKNTNNKEVRYFKLVFPDEEEGRIPGMNTRESHVSYDYGSRESYYREGKD